MGLIDKLHKLISGEKRTVSISLVGDRPTIVNYKINGRDYNPERDEPLEQDVFYQNALSIAQEAYKAKNRKSD